MEEKKAHKDMGDKVKQLRSTLMSLYGTRSSKRAGENTPQHLASFINLCENLNTAGRFTKASAIVIYFLHTQVTRR